MKTIIFFLIVIIFTSCTYFRKNDSGDKYAAEQIAYKFYKAKNEKDFKSFDTLISKSFWKVKDTSQFRKEIDETLINLGKLLEKNLVDWNTQVTLGTTNSGDYILVYKNKYEKGEVNEVIKMKLESDGKTRIVGYNLSVNQIDVNTQ